MSPLSVVSNSTSSVVTHTYLSYKLIWYVTCQSDELLYQKWQGSTTVKSFKFVVSIVSILLVHGDIISGCIGFKFQ